VVVGAGQVGCSGCCEAGGIVRERPGGARPKEHPDTELIGLSAANRDELLTRVLSRLRSIR
jgi:hypothetical protein